MAEAAKRTVLMRAAWFGGLAACVPLMLGAGKLTATPPVTDQDQAVIANLDLLEHWELAEHLEAFRHWDELKTLEPKTPGDGAHTPAGEGKKGKDEAHDE